VGDTELCCHFGAESPSDLRHVLHSLQNLGEQDGRLWRGYRSGTILESYAARRLVCVQCTRRRHGRSQYTPIAAGDASTSVAVTAIHVQVRVVVAHVFMRKQLPVGVRHTKGLSL
jgi:hypothetical protein